MLNTYIWWMDAVYEVVQEGTSTKLILVQNPTAEQLELAGATRYIHN